MRTEGDTRGRFFLIGSWDGYGRAQHEVDPIVAVRTCRYGDGFYLCHSGLEGDHRDILV